MKKSITLFVITFLLILTSGISAKNISGIVYNTDTNTPVNFTNIFIANTSKQIYTNSNGTFNIDLSNNGVINLVAAHISYNTRTFTIPESSDSTYLVIHLTPIIYELNEIKVIRDDPNRVKFLKQFTGAFIGESKNAKKCDILNPRSIHFKEETLDTTSKFKFRNYSIAAKADSSIVFYNKKLGYRVNSYLDYFHLDYFYIAYHAYPFYEDLISYANNPHRV